MCSKPPGIWRKTPDKEPYIFWLTPDSNKISPIIINKGIALSVNSLRTFHTAFKASEVAPSAKK